MMTINKTLGIYIHIPFCIKKCRYCDFLSFGGAGFKKQNDYVNALLREIEYYGQVYRNRYYVDTIFIGGGTPSLLTETLISSIITAVKDNFQVNPSAEITIESNPKTLTGEKLESFLKTGINRISIGAQSLNNDLLKFMGRVHSAGDFLDNYKSARDAGFNNINVDLMFGIPGQTLKIWMHTLNHVLELEPEHVSFYSLQLEEGTPFYIMIQEGSLEAVTDDLDRKMYHSALKTLDDVGYTHYEISNSAKKGFECKHNLKYWSFKDYLGVGLGAHSFMDGIRFSNRRNLSEYINTDNQINSNDLDFSSNPFVEWKHINTRQDDISEYLFTGLRKTEGIDLKEFHEKFNIDVQNLYNKTITKFINEKLLIINNGKLLFTLKGIDLSNRVFIEFI